MKPALAIAEPHPARESEPVRARQVEQSDTSGAIDENNSQVVRVRRALIESGYSQLQDVTVFATDGGVVLVGIVPSYFMKQIAQEIARSAGARTLENRITVENR